jgi:methionyl-tRNA synthetase
MQKKFFISTAIDYPSLEPHIGHAYEKICADIVARFKRLQGFRVHFSTGTDEHGLKIQRSAERAGVHPKQFVDEMSKKFQECWKKLNISYDDFIRTTDEKHVKAVEQIFRRIYEAGDIYKGVYSGLYCVDCETYYTEKELIDGMCPVHKRKPEIVEEEGYFFRMSKYQDKILEHIEKDPDFIRPESRRNEIISRLKEPLRDLCISRTGFDWGIPVPNDEKHVIYVWVDALINYLSTIGYPNPEFKEFWPADLHVIGKDIAWHHCVIWSSILLSLGLELPKKIFVHGFITVDGQKISKSLGNVIDPAYLAEKYSADAVRYFVIRDIPLGEDGDFSENILRTRLNDELADILGNFVHRVLSFAHNNFNGEVPEPGEMSTQDREILEQIKITSSTVENAFENLDLGGGLREIIKLAKLGNKYFNDEQPWRTLKENPRRCATAIYVCIQLVRSLAIMLAPYLPSTSEKIWRILNLPGKVHEQRWNSASEVGLKQGHKINRPEPLFMKLENKQIVAEKKKELPEKEEKFVTPEEFSRLDIRVAKIVEAKRVPNSKKLLEIKIEMEGERRTIVAGIAEHYSPEELMDKHIIVIANMKPVKLMGIRSEGMLLAAEDDGRVSILTVDRPVKSGSKVR